MSRYLINLFVESKNDPSKPGDTVTSSVASVPSFLKSAISSPSSLGSVGPMVDNIASYSSIEFSEFCRPVTERKLDCNGLVVSCWMSLLIVADGSMISVPRLVTQK